jgi:3-(3-hydroxy-phenyl)propionate hydroxylase
MSGRISPTFPFARPPELDGRGGAYPAVIAGAGLVGLTLALDLARRGIATVVVDEDHTVSVGSRAICFAKRTLEIYDRLGLGTRMLDKGVQWNTGRVFRGARELFSFDLLPEAGHRFPAFVNLQQYYAEEWLVAACQATGLVDLRWHSRITGIEAPTTRPVLTIATPQGIYRMEADWLLACDGARSTIRRAMALPFTGRVFQDRFLIADVAMQAPFPAERWFWFAPPFHPGGNVLLHRQPDDVWRIDFQLPPDADPEEEARPGRVIPRVREMLPDIPFELEWVSVYTFRCRRLERFVHGRTVFVGDAAHQVSPFGARGGNSGVQDADNLGWKLAAVLRGADASLIASYDAERTQAADENILHSTRTTDFLGPVTPAARAYREAVLDLAADHAWARPLVNAGRLSRPTRYAGSTLSTPDDAQWDGGVPAGAPAEDAPVLRNGVPDWLLPHLGGAGFTLLAFQEGLQAAQVASLRDRGVSVVVLTDGTAPPHALALHDHSGLAARRYAAGPGACVMFRPDQHVAARWCSFDAASVHAALDRAAAMPARVPA